MIISMEHMGSNPEEDKEKKLSDLEQELSATHSDSLGLSRKVSADDAERLESIRKELDVSGGKQTIPVKGFEESVSFPVKVEPQGFGFNRLVKRYLSVGLAALGLSGASKLDAQTTNEIDKAAAKGSGTNLTEVVKSPENTEGPFVYEQKSWDIRPEIKKAATERLQKRSGGASVFVAPKAKEYTPPAPTEAPKNVGPAAKQRTERTRQNVNVRNEAENRGYRPKPLIEINTQRRAPVSDEVLRLDKNGRWVRERRLGS